MRELQRAPWIIGALITVMPAFGSLMPVGPVNLGTGMVDSVLTIQNSGTASGCVGTFGGSDLLGLAACPGGFTGNGGNEVSPGTATVTIGQLSAAGVISASNLILLFHSAEPGGTPVSVADLALVFFDVVGGTSFTATLPGTPIRLTTTTTGDVNSGFGFRLDSFRASLANDFFLDRTNVVGAAATVTGSTGAVNSFLLGAAPLTGAVPEPRTSLGFGAGLLAICAAARSWRVCRRSITR